MIRYSPDVWRMRKRCVYKRSTRHTCPRFCSYGSLRPAVRTQASTNLFYQPFIHPTELQQTQRPISICHHSKKTLGRRASVWIPILCRPSISTSPLPTWSSKTKAETRIKSERQTWRYKHFERGKGSLRRGQASNRELWRGCSVLATNTISAKLFNISLRSLGSCVEIVSQ